MPNLAKSTDIDYAVRVNRTIDHVVAHLDAPLKLDDIAAVAAFSPFHFHRVFKALVGETLNQFVKRLRLERALWLLSHRPEMTLTDVALACGFSSSSDFSRSFKKRYGVPPSAFDLATYRDLRRDQLASLFEGHGADLARLPAGSNPDGFEAELRELPARTVAYLRVHRPYEGTGVVDTAAELVGWARAGGLERGQWLGYTWDDPELVPLERCRYDVGLVVPDRLADDRVSWLELPPMRVAELAIAGDIELEMRALDYLFCTWLPTSGLSPADQPCFEAWDGLPFEHGMEHFELRAQLPVE